MKSSAKRDLRRKYKYVEKEKKRTDRAPLRNTMISRSFFDNLKVLNEIMKNKKRAKASFVLEL